MRQRGIVYLGLLAVQTAAATFMVWVAFPLFQQVIARPGELQEAGLRDQVAIISATLVLHCAYWSRYRWIAVQAPIHSAFVGHVIQFAGRASFFFGGAVFSAIFFRHLPELDALPAPGQAAIKGLILMWGLFSLFCYSLELDRLGKAIEQARAAK
ncbi:hypothetical protein CR492_04600 [Methylocella silvestris]|uniref:Transmembrane protein n=1 Tax=Methylocella silvestris TaxID=199596 RepID=A0A2J7TK56_METSI|nr:hypothetical protein CR492_04600 [Methylocella silvestris]